MVAMNAQTLFSMAGDDSSEDDFAELSRGVFDYFD
jgi:hypothetical protein